MALGCALLLLFRVENGVHGSGNGNLFFICGRLRGLITSLRAKYVSQSEFNTTYYKCMIQT